MHGTKSKVCAVEKPREEIFLDIMMEEPTPVAMGNVELKTEKNNKKALFVNIWLSRFWLKNEKQEDLTLLLV